ncbi:glycoside hydrolase family 16 protein [Phreatobacter sp.]|uniref:glycoside hydrolase family 16 protein n=1 Tax=Phreatobacter sp. TaxID=1966341 RepID=UPI003F6FDC3F
MSDARADRNRRAGTATLRPNRRLLLGSPALLAGPAVLVARSPAIASVPDDPVQGRSVAFEDSFASLDPDIWLAGPKTTTAEPGFYGRSAFARITGEEGFNPYAIVDDTAALNGKALQMTARHIGRRMTVPKYYGNAHPEYQWISGNIQTARRDGTVMRGWRNGYFEARMWMPRHPLTWPAFWLMNSRSILAPQTSIEIDIVEHKGFEPTLYGTYLHEWGGKDVHHEGVGVPTGVDVTQGYYRYGMLVEGASCIPYFERRPVIDPRTRRPVAWTIGRAGQLDRDNDTFWMLVTLALRADVRYPSPLEPEHRQAHLRVDYVRVYQ